MPQPTSLSAFPDSPYAAELQRGLSTGGAFSKHLEQEYLRSRLADNRALIRVTCVLGVLLSSFGVLRNILEGSASLGHLIQLSMVCLSSVVLATIVCSPLFERLYLPVARIVVPVRNALSASLVAKIAAQGQLETLMVLPLMVLGPYFLLGLPPRVALLSVVTTIASFGVSAAAFALPLPAAAFASSLLILVTVCCVIAARHIDEGLRKSFLESRLIAEFAEHDALTGTKNRRVFDEHLDRLWQRAVEDGRSIAVLLIDVDNFKKYNDRYGHQAGDRTLRHVADALQCFASRPLDVLARYGGEEFAVVLNDTESGQAARLADQMRQAVVDLGIEQREGISGMVTVSIGVAALAPSEGRSSRGALQLADQALYEAKVCGRNRVELKLDEDYTLLVTGVFSKGSAPGVRPDQASGTVSLRLASVGTPKTA